MKLQLYWLFFIITLNSCSSYKEFEHLSRDVEIPALTFRATFIDSWTALKKVITQMDLDVDINNQEAGIIKTNWNENTMQMNFADSFGGKDAVKEAKYKLIINVIKGFRGGREVTKVTIFKRQMVNEDFLQGWKIVPSDRIQEDTMLYRVGQVLKIQNQLKRIDEEKRKAEEEAVTF